jgi:hypothetical protein
MKIVENQMITHILCAPFFPKWVFHSKNGSLSRHIRPDQMKEKSAASTPVA